MKTLSIITLAILLIACTCATGDNSATVEQPTAEQPADEQPVAEQLVAEQPADTTDSEQNIVEANSGATNVFNYAMLNGTMMVPAQNNITITLPMGGIISSFTHLPGDSVRKGEVVAVLENMEFIDLQQSYLEAKAQCNFLETEYNRQKLLSVEDATSQKRLQQSLAEYLSMKSRREATSVRLKMLGVVPEKLTADGIASKLVVRAPQSGYISEVMVNQGKYVASGEAICHIINKSQIFLNLIAYEKDLQNIHKGQTLEFRVNGLGDETFTATVTSIDQRVDPVNRSVKVYAKVTHAHPEFRPGMYITVKIK